MPPTILRGLAPAREISKFDIHTTATNHLYTTLQYVTRRFDHRHSLHLHCDVPSAFHIFITGKRVLKASAKLWDRNDREIQIFVGRIQIGNYSIQDLRVVLRNPRGPSGEAEEEVN
jgi:hypothetical protein